MLRDSLLILALSGCVCSFGQPETFAPDKNAKGKYALVKGSSKTPVTGYDYSFISDGQYPANVSAESGFPLFSGKQGNTWGILKHDGTWLLSPTEMDSLWMLRSRDAFKLLYSDRSYSYVNINGQVIASDIVDEKRSPYARYRVLVKRDGTQSIIYQGKEVVKPIPYELDLEIQNLAQTFLVKNQAGYYVINLDGFPLNTEPFQAATPIDFNGNLAVKDAKGWMILDKTLRPVDGKYYTRIVRRESEFDKRYFYLCYQTNETDIWVYGGDIPVLISPDPVSEFEVEKSFGVAKRNGKWGVLVPEIPKFTAFTYDSFDKIDNNEAYYHLIYCSSGGFYSIIDEEGHIYYADLKLEKIKPITCSTGAQVMLFKGGKVALVDNPEKEPSPSFLYDEAVCSEHGYFLKKDGKWGMIDNDGKVVVDFTHSSYESIGK